MLCSLMLGCRQGPLQTTTAQSSAGTSGPMYPLLKLSRLEVFSGQGNISLLSRAIQIVPAKSLVQNQVASCKAFRPGTGVPDRGLFHHPCHLLGLNCPISNSVPHFLTPLPSSRIYLPQQPLCGTVQAFPSERLTPWVSKHFMTLL